MPWARLDDQIYFNHKVTSCDGYARAFHIAGIVYCAGQLTDGIHGAKCVSGGADAGLHTTGPMLAAPSFTVISDTYRFEWVGTGYVVELQRIRETRDDVTAECTVASELTGEPEMLYFGRINLVSSQTRNGLAKTLTERANTLDWYDALNQVSILSIRRWREGEPTVFLNEVEPSPTRWLLYPYIEYGGPTTLYARGGSCKSYLAIAIAIGVQTGQPLIGRLMGKPVPVLYLDWESSADTHAERLAALCRAVNRPMPPIAYRRMATILPNAVDIVRREVGRLHTGMIVVDSMALAGGGEVNDSVTALAVFNAIRAIGLPALCIHHMAKGFGADTAIGSVYYENASRIMWQVQKSEHEGETGTAVSLVSTKSNNGQKLMRHAYRLDFVNDSQSERTLEASMTPIDLMTVSDFAERAPLNQRICSVLAHHAPLEPDAISGELALDDKQAKQVGPWCSRLKKKGTLLYFPGRGYALAAHE